MGRVTYETGCTGPVGAIGISTARYGTSARRDSGCTRRSLGDQTGFVTLKGCTHCKMRDSQRHRRESALDTKDEEDWIVRERRCRR